MNNLKTCPPHLSDVATLPWEIQTTHFSTLWFIYFRLFTLPQKKTNSNCCTAALAVYLLLFSASYYLHSLSTASPRGTLQEDRVYWYGHVEACGSGLLRRKLNFQHSLLYYATDQCWKRLEACINAEGGHSEHLLWHCLPDILVATHHNWFSSEPPTFDRTQQTFSQMKRFCISQVNVVTYLGGVGKWVTVCFLLR